MGETDNEAQWIFPVKQNASPKVIGDLKFNNNTSRKLLTNAKKITDSSVVDQNRKENT